VTWGATAWRPRAMLAGTRAARTEADRGLGARTEAGRDVRHPGAGAGRDTWRPGLAPAPKVRSRLQRGLGDDE
jgi:hypothetical protein